MKKNQVTAREKHATAVTIQAEGFSFLQIYVNKGKNRHIGWT